MNKKFILKITGSAAAVCFLVCEPVPQNAIDDARTALEKAEKSGAQAWASTQLTTGHAFYDSAMKELSVEKKKLPFKRNYDKIIKLLDIATEAGQYALESMQTANEHMRSQSRELLDKAKDLADSMESALKAAAVHKMDVGRLHAALDSAKMAQKEALALLNGGDPLLAEESAVSANNKTEEVAKRIVGTLPPQKKGVGKRK
jgi:hypothetical protein